MEARKGVIRAMDAVGSRWKQGRPPSVVGVQMERHTQKVPVVGYVWGSVERTRGCGLVIDRSGQDEMVPGSLWWLSSGCWLGIE